MASRYGIIPVEEDPEFTPGDEAAAPSFLPTTVGDRTSPRYSRPERRLTDLLRLLVAAPLDILTPTITIRHLTSKGPQKLRSTAYLDGLRGIAALIVAIFHFNCDFWPNRLMRGYGSPPLSDQPANHYLFQLPFLRIVVAGRFTVLIFFCISGYVLSVKPLHLSHTRRYTALLQSLQSSLFRRWTRIMLPCLASTLLVSLLASLRLLHPSIPPNWQQPFLPTSANPQPGPGFTRVPTLPTTSKQLAHWLRDALTLADPWRFGRYTRMPYNPALWTMQAELLGSLVVYGLVLALARTRPRPKLAILALLALHMSSTARYIYVPFLGGVILAQVDVVRGVDANNRLDRSCQDAQWRAGSRLAVLWPFGAFAAAVYAGSLPENAAATPGFGMLARAVVPWWPEKEREYFWPTVSAVMLVGALGRSPVLRRGLEARWVQYLGEMSFALYVLHLPLIESVGTRLVPGCVRAIGRLVVARGEKGELKGEIGGWAGGVAVVCGCMLLVMLWLWAADVFTRVVDRGAVRISKRLNEWVMVDETDEKGYT